MEIVVFKITGISPLLMNNPAAMDASKGTGLGAAKKVYDPSVEAAIRLYKNDDDTLYFPSMAFRSSIVGTGGGASGRKIGKRSANSVVASSVFLAEGKAMLIHPDTEKPIKDYTINTMRVVVQKAGVLRCRPEISPWACFLSLEVDRDFMPDNDILLQLLNISGKVAGIGDFRPQRKGAYGRFRAELRE